VGAQTGYNDETVDADIFMEWAAGHGGLVIMHSNYDLTPRTADNNSIINLNTGSSLFGLFSNCAVNTLVGFHKFRTRLPFRRLSTVTAQNAQAESDRRLGSAS